MGSPWPYHGYLLACLLWASLFIMVFSQSWQSLLLIFSILCVAVCAGNTPLSAHEVLGRCPIHHDALDTFTNATELKRPHTAHAFAEWNGSAGTASPRMAASPEAAADEGELWVMRPSPGKGLGVFAKRRIPRGTRVLVEEPLFAIEPPAPVRGLRNFGEMMARIDAGFEALAPSDQAAYLACHSHHGADEPAVGRHLYVFRSNAYTMPDGRWGMFLKMARINHSCQPNVANSWAGLANGTAGKGVKVAWALRDIEEGEEILITYVRLLQGTEGRRRRLEQYGFRCECEACQRGHEGGDERRARMGVLMEELDGVPTPIGEEVEPEEAMGYLEQAEELIRLLEVEKLADYFGRAYRHAAGFANRSGRVAEARVWATKVWELERLAGEDSLAAQSAREYVDSLG